MRFRYPATIGLCVFLGLMPLSGASAAESLASKIHNLVSAGDAATISHVLGDKITTVMRAYIQFEQKSALDHYQRSVTRVRNDDEDNGSDAA